MVNAAPHISIKQPAVADAFYPGDKGACTDIVEQCLSSAKPSPVPTPKVIVAPHAGFVFSGPIAGTAYAGLRARAGTISRVVLLGPAHRTPFKGLATTSVDAWATPLGEVPVDWPTLRDVLALPGVQILDEAFSEEHSVEVHLPFLQRALGSFELVPLLVGDASHREVARALDQIWGGPETLIVISSDLSHFHDYDTARQMDRDTSRKIELLQGDKIDGNGACGHRGLGGALLQARRRDLRVTTLDVRNSGDTRGGRDKVVGYGSYAMEYAESACISHDDREMLKRASRAALKFGLEHGREPETQFGSDISSALTAMRASFVTITLDGKLRGCIGSLIAHKPLLLDVVSSAYKAGFGDRRFEPLTEDEIDRIGVGVSILSTPRRMTFSDEADLVRQIRPDQDGLIMQDGDKRGIFLPSVWESLLKSADFIRNLKRKAGLPLDHWSDSLQVYRYTTESFGVK